MSPLKAIALCAILTFDLYLLSQLVQGIQGYAGDAMWWVMLVLTGFVTWVFLRLLLTKEDSNLNKIQ